MAETSGEVPVQWKFPNAQEQRKKLDQSSEHACVKPLTEFLSNGNWRYGPFEWHDDLPAAILKNIVDEGWDWARTSWFKQTHATYSEQALGYAFKPKKSK